MSDTIRAGFISAINYEEGTAQVVYKDRDDEVSPYLPFWSNEYNMPDIDTLVYVVHLQNGSTKGMILIPPFTNEHPPVEGKKGIWRKDWRSTGGSQPHWKNNIGWPDHPVLPETRPPTKECTGRDPWLQIHM